MDQPSFRSLDNFKNSVGIKFQLYNSLFTSLPFHRIEKTGLLLSLFLSHCEDGYGKGLSPEIIMEDFFYRYTACREEKEKMDLLFRFVQYVERQVVLFDALEEAAFTQVVDLHGPGTLRQLENMSMEDRASITEKFTQFSVSLVLTAHPTQFYPGSVLGIINDLSAALKEDHVPDINRYLLQLGKTPLFKKQKPTPYDEAVSLIWYLEHVFYDACGSIVITLLHSFPGIDLASNPVIKMGFWPGGDRDGNRNVTTGITLKVAHALRAGIIRCYYKDIRRLKRRITFKGVEELIVSLEETLYSNIHTPDARIELHAAGMQATLQRIRTIIMEQHNGLFVDLVDALITKVYLFGLHFATLDVRQESSVHTEVIGAVCRQEGSLPASFEQSGEDEKLEMLCAVKATANPELYEGLVRDTLESFRAMKTIQEMNGERGCNRYIISQCNSALDVMQVYALFLVNGWKKEELPVDIVPLFETIEDLKNAPGIMRRLYALPAYREHLDRRNKTQTIMVGFSDGTKDGGYLMANWSIYKAKQELTRLSRDCGFDVIFFDGRGGPPARGGGKTHKYYASMGSAISNKAIQLTVQGQTVSSNFGNHAVAQYNIEQLLHAGLTNALFAGKDKPLKEEQVEALEELAAVSYDTYLQLKTHPHFMDYLQGVSPLKYYSETNISSRPAKRGAAGPLSLSDLRAIPFVGAWSQIKQNVPGFFGLGTALETLERKGKFGYIQHLYGRSPYFKTLLDNCEMAMMKSFFPLTAYLAEHPEFGSIWKMVHEEFDRTRRYLFLLSGNQELMHDYPVERLSICMRERIVLPLTTIQQYALTCIRKSGTAYSDDKSMLDQLVIRSSFGIINAGRNSV
jgi:phosphoenolpyruvate carboxylase